jgi:hypothetical protein
MPDSTETSRLAIAKEFLRHIGHSNASHAIGLLSERVTYRVQGDNALAGVFAGRDEIVAHLTQVMQKTMGTFEAYKWEDWMVGEHHVAGLADFHAQTEQRRVRGREVVVVGFDVADKIDAITVFFDDQAAMDRFVGR